MKTASYTELPIWTKSLELSSWIYHLTRAFPFEEMSGLVARTRDCSLQIPSCIAEGFGKNLPKYAIDKFFEANTALYSLETHVYMAYTQGYIQRPTLDDALVRIRSCRNLLKAFIEDYKEQLKNPA